jgi:lysylphosphatidylglycerol synthetase-like protein (DUF2156 family)
VLATTTAIATEDLVLQAIRQYTQADNPSAFLALNRETEAFTCPDVEGVIAYRQAGRYLVQFGGPFAPEGSYETLLGRFVQHAQERGLQVTGIQLQRHDAEIYRRHGFTVNQIGSSWAVALEKFTLRGGRFMQLRNKISLALRNGLEVQEVDADEWADAIAEVDRGWLASKGEGAHQLEFLVGQTGGFGQAHRRLFLGRIEGRPVGYVSYSPAYGSRAGWMHDLSRRLPDGSPGIMEAINSTAIEVFRREGTAWLHFGFTPFTGLDATAEVPGHDLGFQWLMHALWAEGAALYPAQTQLAYKQKWAPDLAIPEYVAFHGPASVAAFVHVFRACNAF